jgi:hypothetical protein
MKELYTLLTAVVITASAFAQSPEKMSYQAVIRNTGNALVANQAVGMQISIIQENVSGNAVYVETQTPTTNSNGLVSIEIGTGDIVIGVFSSIDWSSGPYFIKMETDPTGGTNYSITGTSQLLSVPYALYAKTAENVSNDAVDDADADPNNELQAISRTGTTVSLTNGGTFEDSVGVYTAGEGINITNNVISVAYPTYSIGLWPELGGYVFRISPDGKHGLVVESQDQSVKIDWYTARDVIVAPENHSADGQQFVDWRLPNKYELNEIYLQKTAIGNFLADFYWTSTESGTSTAWCQFMDNGFQYSHTTEYNNAYVRAVRAF